jgi:apolipoprotein N-acyltransferase
VQSPILAFPLGALSVLAFSPFKFWWLVLITIALLRVLHHRLQRPALTGFFFGLGYFGFGVSWVFNSLYEFGQAPWLVAVLMTLCFVMALSLLISGCLMLASRLESYCPSLLAGDVIFIALWLIMEWLRGWLFTGFPWLLLGHSVIDSPLQAVFPIFGTLGASAVILILALLLLAMFRAVQSSSRSFKLPLVASLSLVAVLLALGQKQWTEEVAGSSLKVAIMQGNIPVEMKWSKDQRAELYAIYLEMSQDYLDHDLIIWPETAIPNYFRVAARDYLGDFRDQLIASSTQLLSGSFRYQEQPEKSYNSVVVVGKELQKYDKQHLVPFGEYIPLRAVLHLFRQFVSIPMSDLSPGTGAPLLSIAGIPVGISICYEAVFGSEVIRALPEAQMFINIANDSWFGDSIGPHQHLQITRVRARETERYLLRSTSTGISAVIDPMGRVLQQTEQFKRQTLSAEVQARKGHTPYSYWGDSAILILTLGLLVIALGPASGRVKSV